MTIELHGGKIRYNHKFGSKELTLLTDGIYNDDEWHVIDATRVEGAAILKVKQIKTNIFFHMNLCKPQ